MDARHRYGTLLAAVRAGECDEWELEGPAHVAALALALDQLARKTALGAREAFSGDAAAHVLARSVADAGEDAQLPPALQLLVALPLLHAERISDQCVAAWWCFLCVVGFFERFFFKKT